MTPANAPLPTPDAVEAGIAAGDMVLLDVRELDEVAQSGMARGALHVPLMSLPMRADPQSADHLPDIDPDKTVVIYCAVGGRAAQAGAYLNGLGFDKVINYGGLSDWVRAGGAVD
ncbi:rhodanese-like domain-containing protein [Aquimixticola soesokkakensis]|nr:rhodanese-like domain-containing protein [Aquimixticola soesokkakensis]